MKCKLLQPGLAPGFFMAGKDFTMTHGLVIACEQKFIDLDLKGASSGAGCEGFFSGYASVFGETDLGKDVIEPGAFSRSLRAKGADGIRMLFQHDPATPLGRWVTIREDRRGLFVAGELSPGVARAEEVRRLMKSGALDGLSIGFQTVRSRRDARTGVRHILEADLWEISIVTFPMLASARVSEVKQIDATGEGRTLAQKLRRAAHLLRS